MDKGRPCSGSSKPDGSRHHGQRPRAPGMAVGSAARRAVSSPRDPASWGRRCHSVLSPSTTWPLGSPRAWLARVALAFPRADGHRGHSRDVRVLRTAEQGGGSGRPQGRKGVLRVFPALSSDTLKNRQDAQLHDTATVQRARRADGGAGTTSPAGSLELG